ncbi:MAG: HIG1 domain-containing protein [Magnetospirillum sp.]|nr:HIG1 domain-containing protein [Magnetospirillum sp.]
MAGHLVQALLGLILTLVVAILAAGIFGFAKGSPWYDRNANRLMQMRIAAQALAILLLALLVWAIH